MTPAGRPAAHTYPYTLGAAIFLVQVALGIVLFATFQEWVPNEFGVSDGWGGYLLAAYGGARFSCELPTGALADRIERRLTLLAGFALMLPALALMAVTGNELVFLAMAAGLGIATAFLWPAAYAISADLYPVERRGKVIGFLNLLQLIGFGLGALSGAFLVKTADWAQFFVAGTAVALAFLAVLTRLSNYRESGLFHVSSRGGRPSLREVLSRRLAALATIVVCASAGLAMVVPAIRPYGENELGVSFEELTLAFAPAVTVAAFVYLPAGHLTDRFGRIRPFLAGESLVVAGLLVCASTESLWIASAGATLIFGGNVLTVPALNAEVMDLAPATHRGTLIGLVVALTGLSLAVGPAIGGVIVGGWGAQAAFRVAACSCLAAAIGIALYGRFGRAPQGGLPA